MLDLTNSLLFDSSLLNSRSSSFVSCIFFKSVNGVLLKKLVVAGRQDKLLFSTSNKIKEIDMETGIVKELVNLGTTAYSIAYDVKERYAYASRYARNSIVK